MLMGNGEPRSRQEGITHVESEVQANVLGTEKTKNKLYCTTVILGLRARGGEVRVGPVWVRMWGMMHWCRSRAPSGRCRGGRRRACIPHDRGGKASDVSALLAVLKTIR